MHRNNDNTVSYVPTRKVGLGAGAIGLPLGIVIAWALQEFANVEVPVEVASAIGSIASFVGAYFVPSGS